MISRRNIRVKVMQTLYGLEASEDEVGTRKAVTALTSKINQTKQLFVYLLFFITEVARYAETDARKKASKHLPTAADLAVNTKLVGNELVWLLLENEGFSAAVDRHKMRFLIDEDILKKTYQQLVLSEEYHEYISAQSRDKKAEKRILEFILNSLLLPNENFTSHVEEHFINWEDDAEMMQLLVQNYLNKPNNADFNHLLSEDKWEFAKNLLETAIEKSAFTKDLIKPKLKNWDADRIASLDLVILQMGICEFLYFETIPTRVTINEYIDLAKAYSTPQSGHFVNGLLDNLHKELQQENKIHKKTFKNSTL